MEGELEHAHREHDETHWWFRGRRRIIETVLDRWAPEVDGPVIDVGCGAGGLLRTLAGYGRVTGIEGSPDLAAAAAERNPGADIRCAQLPGGLDAQPGYRIASAFDVIEHVDDDVALLRAMREVLLPGGIVCVTVPAMPSLWSRHDDANGHKRRYTASRLQASFEAAGLDVVHLSHFNVVLLPVIAAVRALERFRPPRAATDFDRSVPASDAILARILSAERHAVARWRVPLGVSLIAVAKPR